MENQILIDPAVKPDDNILENTLGKHYKILQEFEEKINKLSLALEWYYYRDAKSWLCKVQNKKKNFCWLSVWNTGFKLTFYFPERTIKGVYELDINDEIKKNTAEMKPVGKSHPVIISVKNKKAMNDGLKILRYKMNVK
jgi:hypothetical protein